MDFKAANAYLELSSVLISIVIPYYNKKDTILRSVNSVIAQTYTNWELIIIDDCGEDRIQENMLPQDDRIRVLFNESNKGAALTRQRGLENSNGEYIAFLDADDWWAPLFLEQSLKEHFVDKELLMTWTERVRVLPNGQTMVDRNSKLEHTKLRETIIKFRRPWQTGGVLWRKGKVTNWCHLDLNEDMFFEIHNSEVSNKISKVTGELFFQGLDSNYSLSQNFENFIDEKTKFICWIELWNNHRKKLKLQSRLTLLLRIIKYLYKKAQRENKKFKFYLLRLIFLIGQKTPLRVEY